VSLASRLCAFFLAALALVLAGFSASLYLLTRAQLHRQADERLAAALHTLAAAAEQEPDGLAWEPHEHPIDLGPLPWEVRDGVGLPVDHSPAGAPDAAAAGGAPADADGHAWLVGRRRLTATGTAAGPGRYAALELTAAVPLDPVHAALRQLAGTLAALSAGVWLAAALAGRWVARRALAPLAGMAAAARGMGAADLGRRLPDPGTGDELGDLRLAFNGLLDRVAEAFERQRRFTGDASHQLRTPLTAMLGQVEVALRRDRGPDEYRDVLARVREQAGRMRDIVEALLFLARADAEAGIDPPSRLDLASWLPEQLARWAEHPRAADLHAGPPAGGPLWVRAQPVLLAQLLDNLVENAFKYTGPGTPVTVSLGREADAATLAVEDAGLGVAAEDLPHLFEPFYRASGAARRPGVGLGLAVARRIAAAFGGTLAAASTPGRGSRFTLRLPAARAESGQAAGPGQPAPAEISANS
jgi:heavy metal sensor kinase